MTESELVSVRAYARLKGVSETAIRKHVKSGLLTLQGDKKQIDPVQADKALSVGIDPAQVEAGNAKLATGKASGGRKQAGMVSLYEARTARANFAARREKIAVERERLELAEKQGKLIDRMLVESAWFEKGRMIRDRMLSIPDRLSALLASISDAARVHELLDSEMRKALNDVADEVTIQ